MNMACKTVLITGSTDGVGRYVAAHLAADGAKVLIHGRDAARAGTLVDEIKRGGHEAPTFYQADLSSLAGVRQLADAVMAEHQRLDVLVSNAGIGSQTPARGGAKAPTALSCALPSTISAGSCWPICCCPC